MNIRRISAVLLAALTLPFVAACGSSGSDGDQATSSTEVTFWSFLKGSDAVAEAFNKSHPGITVTFETQAGGAEYYTKLSNAVSSGDVPDVAVAEYIRLPEIVSLEGAEDLSELSGDVVVDNFPEATRELVELGGRTWGVPRDAAPMLYLYRKDFFDQHGLEVPKTWAEYEALAEKVKAIDKKKYAGMYLTADSNMFSALSWQAGASWFDTEDDSWQVGINDEPTKRVAEYWQRLVRNDLVAPFPSFTDELYRSVQQGDLVGYVCASWCAGGLQATVPDQKGKWAVAELPSWDGQPTSAMWGGSSFIVPKGAENAEAAAEFIEWITTDPEGIAAWYADGTSSMYPADPELVPVAKDGFVTDYFGGQDIFAVDSASYDSVRSGWAWGPTMAATDQVFAGDLGKVVDGSADLADITDEAQRATVEAMRGRGLDVTE